MVRAKKKWGQHWLASRGLADRLVDRMELGPAAEVVEIGPGTGLLTRALLEQGARVTAIEIDPERANDLRDHAANNSRLRVVEGDVLEAPIEWPSVAVRLVGNLPYNASGPILGWTCSHAQELQDAHFMLQLEVAERVAAVHGNRVYGALSVHVQWHFEVKLLQKLPPGAFRPPPKVDSAFVRLTPRDAVAPSAHAQRVLRAGFAHRRKTLRKALAHAGWAPDVVAEGLAGEALAEDARAEALAPDVWLRFAESLPRAS